VLTRSRSDVPCRVEHGHRPPATRAMGPHVVGGIAPRRAHATPPPSRSPCGTGQRHAGRGWGAVPPLPHLADAGEAAPCLLQGMTTLPTTPTLEDAIALVAQAHRGQTYPIPGGAPFILHPLRVMLHVESPAARIVAVLHDLIKDTPPTPSLICAPWLPPPAICAALDLLTHRDADSYDAYITRLAPDPLARRVKLADLAITLPTIAACPPTRSPTSPATSAPSPTCVPWTPTDGTLSTLEAMPVDPPPRSSPRLPARPTPPPPTRSSLPSTSSPPAPSSWRPPPPAASASARQ